MRQKGVHRAILGNTAKSKIQAPLYIEARIIQGFLVNCWNCSVCVLVAGAGGRRFRLRVDFAAIDFHNRKSPQSMQSKEEVHLHETQFMIIPIDALLSPRTRISSVFVGEYLL